MTMTPKNASEALADFKPCPWCGGTITGTVSEGSTFRWRKVDGCCADGPEVRHDTMADDQFTAEIDSRKRAIEAWNERDPRIAQLESELAKLREAVRAAPVVKVYEGYDGYAEIMLEPYIEAKAKLIGTRVRLVPADAAGEGESC